MNRQKIVTDVRLAALLSYMRYQFRVVNDPMGIQFLFADPGDIDEAVEAYERGDQVASAKDLLLMYDTFLAQMKGGSTTVPAVTITTPHGESRELVKANIPTVSGRDWTTAGLTTAIFLCYRGNELLHTYVDDGRTKFTFAYDDGLTEAVSLLNQRKIRVEPTEWQVAGSQIRKAMHEAKGY